MDEIEQREKRAVGRPLKVVLVLLVAAGLFAGGYDLGGRDRLNTVPAGEGRVTGQGTEPPMVLSDDVSFQMFWDVWNLAKQEYVDQPVSDKDLFYGALQGLLWGLGDPYSTYFTPEDAQSFNNELSGTFFGIGAEIGVKDDAIVVIAPLPNTPADNAGVRAEDAILAIDGTSTLGMNVSDAVDLIRGDKGTTVTLTLSRVGVDIPFDVAIVRDAITVESVKLTMRDDGVAVIRLSVFNDDTANLFSTAVDELLAKNAKGVVLDLRNDPGGVLDGAIHVAGYWINTDTVVIESAHGENTEFKADGVARLAGMPTVVLVNGGSASASEILAGALQDYGDATIVGTQTFGKGSVQEYRELPDGSAVKITVAKWLTSKGRSIDHEGITPDDIVEAATDQTHANADPQFDEALRQLATK